MFALGLNLAGRPRPFVFASSSLAILMSSRWMSAKLSYGLYSIPLAMQYSSSARPRRAKRTSDWPAAARSEMPSPMKLKGCQYTHVSSRSDALTLSLVLSHPRSQSQPFVYTRQCSTPYHAPMACYVSTAASKHVPRHQSPHHSPRYQSPCSPPRP